MKLSKLTRGLCVEQGARFRIKEQPTDLSQIKGLRHDPGDELKAEAKEVVRRNLEVLAERQELLYATGRFAVLVVFQAMDTGGKDGMIKHVMSGLNPQGCQVSSFKRPSEEELRHDFLWRYSNCLPERGKVGIFNRSYYEDVLVVRVHPEFLRPQQLVAGNPGEEFWRARYEDINCFERRLARNGTLILKFFLHISKQEQRKRLLARLDDPSKHWKFSAGDVAEREYWPDYMAAFEAAIRATSTKWAPWHVIPSDHKWLARAAVSDILRRELEALKLPELKLDPRQTKELAAARRALEGGK